MVGVILFRHSALSVCDRLPAAAGGGLRRGAPLEHVYGVRRAFARYGAVE